MDLSTLQLHWHSPLLLLLLLPWLLILRYAWKQRRPGFIVGTLVYAKNLKDRRLLYRLPFILEGLAGVLFILALARPQEVSSKQPRTLSGIDIMICLDVSGSMEAVDIPDAGEMSEAELLMTLDSGEHPTRLEAARQEISTFVNRRKTDRLGLIAFSGITLSKCPPTLDHHFLFEQVKTLRKGIMENVSTNIAAPIAAAVDRLQDSPAPRRVIILLTDGEHAEKSAATPQQAAEAANQFGITIHCISLGSPNAYIRDDTFFGTKWHPITHFDPGMLKEIAKTTGGMFLTARDATGMKTVLDTLDNLETTEADKVEQINYRECFQPLVWGAGVLIIASIVLGATILLRIP